MMMTEYLFKSMEKEGEPVILYLHPWEIDTDLPIVQTKLVRRIRHYAGIRQMEGKLVSLLRKRRFGTIRQYLEERIALEDADRPAKYERNDA